MYKNKKIVAIVCAYNEEGKVGKTVKAIPRDLIDEIVVIDDGSADKTGEEAKEYATVLRHKTNLGVGVALKTGIKYAIDNKFDICVTIAGDNQDETKDVNRLIRSIVDDNYDIVIGSRYLGTTKNMPKFRHITTRMYTWFFNICTGSNLTDASNGFRAIKTDLFKNINIWQEWLNRYELEPYLLWHAVKKYRVTEVPTTKRFDIKLGFSKMKIIIDWWRILKPLVYLKLKIKK
jgi:dolichol-phosphate mannosyltransferase